MSARTWTLPEARELARQAVAKDTATTAAAAAAGNSSAARAPLQEAYELYERATTALAEVIKVEQRPAQLKDLTDAAEGYIARMIVIREALDRPVAAAGGGGGGGSGGSGDQRSAAAALAAQVGVSIEEAAAMLAAGFGVGEGGVAL